MNDLLKIGGIVLFSVVGTMLAILIVEALFLRHNPIEAKEHKHE
jgi:hypothetical protein